jgi:parvulin-like peptidyl-prolyl isomerase
MFLPACGNQDRLPSQILLRVDGRTVSLERFQRDFEQILPGDRALPKEEEQALRRSYLAQRIDHELLLAEAAKLHLNVSLQTVQQAMDSHRESYPPGEFDRMLVDKGLTTEDWQRMLNEELLVEKVFDRVVRDKATVSEADIEAYFAAHRQSFIRPERVRARQITVNDESEGRRILERLRQGMPFQEAARRFSISPDAEQGGELGIFARGEMPEAFDLAVFDLPAGRISELIKSEYGYHIFLVEEHLPALKPDLKTVREEIIAILRRQKEEKVYQNWLQNLRQEASIEVDWTLF